MCNKVPGHSNYSTLGVLSVVMNGDAPGAHVACATSTCSLLPSYAATSGRGIVGPEIPHLARFVEAKFKLTSWEIKAANFYSCNVFNDLFSYLRSQCSSNSDCMHVLSELDDLWASNQPAPSYRAGVSS